MSMGGRPGGGMGRGFRTVDEDAQRRQNQEAPKVEDLGPSVVALFRPYRGRLAATAVLVIASAAVGVIPALLVQRVCQSFTWHPVFPQ